MKNCKSCDPEIHDGGPVTEITTVTSLGRLMDSLGEVR